VCSTTSGVEKTASSSKETRKAVVAMRAARLRWRMYPSDSELRLNSISGNSARTMSEVPSEEPSSITRIRGDPFWSRQECMARRSSVFRFFVVITTVASAGEVMVLFDLALALQKHNWTCLFERLRCNDKARPRLVEV